MTTNSILPRRSHGLKLIVICFLVVLMGIPAMFTSYISFERSSRADEVTRDVAQRYGGPQTVLGPTLVVPYARANAAGLIAETGEYVISPETGAAKIADIKTAVRKLSLFKVPTYRANIELKAVFNPVDVGAEPGGRTLYFDQARIVLAVSDGRGLSEDVFLTDDTGRRIKFEPEAFSDPINVGAAKFETIENYREHYGLSARSGMTFLSVPASDITSSDDDFTVKSSISLGGATRLNVLPFAKSTSVNMSADWDAPGFEGGFPPVEREISGEGFSARWSVPYLARGIMGEGPAHSLNLLNAGGKAVGVKFVAQVNPYQTVNRALKYSVMFIGMVFIAYFLFEVLVGVRVHPAQYILIGLAQSVFYLLLLAFSEHLGFSGAFMIAASATVFITAAYAGAVFKERRYAYQSAIVFVLTYGLLYTLMRMQDFALMIGALASFMAIALTMYLTRNIDWYGGQIKPAEPASD